eukprot:jgi/Botrbrau1/11504/Bobra.0198s0002.1
MEVSDHAKLHLLQMLKTAMESPTHDVASLVSASQRLYLFSGTTHAQGLEPSKVALAAGAVMDRAAALVNNSEVVSSVTSLHLVQMFATQSSPVHLVEKLPGLSAAVLESIKRQGSSASASTSWAVLDAIFNRVAREGEEGELRRLAAGFVGKALQAAGPLLTTPELAGQPGEAMLGALGTGLMAVPTSFRAGAQGLERCCEGALLGYHGGAGLRMAAARCLALLPRASGSSEAWTLAMQRLLVTAHAQLDEAFMGLEAKPDVDAFKSEVRADVAPFRVPEGVGRTEGSCPESRASPSVAGTRVGALLDCLERMLTSPFPCPAPVPLGAILSLLFRILSFDGGSGRVAPSVSGYAQLCGVLPALQAAALGILACLVRLGRGATLPHMSSVSGLLSQLLARCTATGASLPPPALRFQLYKAVAEAIKVGGWAVLRDIAEAVHGCAVLELYGPANTDAAKQGEGQERPKKKRKKGLIDMPSAGRGEALSETAAGRAAGSWQPDEVSTQSAMLGLLETLFMVGGSFMPAKQRAGLDAIAGHAASTAAVAQRKLAEGTAPAGKANDVGRLSLAALRALTSSVLAPARHPGPLPSPYAAPASRGSNFSGPSSGNLLCGSSGVMRSSYACAGGPATAPAGPSLTWDTQPRQRRAPVTAPRMWSAIAETPVPQEAVAAHSLLPDPASAPLHVQHAEKDLRTAVPPAFPRVEGPGLVSMPVDFQHDRGDQPHGGSGGFPPSISAGLGAVPQQAVQPSGSGDAAPAGEQRNASRITSGMVHVMGLEAARVAEHHGDVSREGRPLPDAGPMEGVTGTVPTEGVFLETVRSESAQAAGGEMAVPLDTVQATASAPAGGAGEGVGVPGVPREPSGGTREGPGRGGASWRDAESEDSEPLPEIASGSSSSEDESDED